VQNLARFVEVKWNYLGLIVEEGIGAECMNMKCEYELAITCTMRTDQLRETVRAAHSFMYNLLKNVKEEK
jgi:hypothetical protein